LLTQLWHSAFGQKTLMAAATAAFLPNEAGCNLSGKLERQDDERLGAVGFDDEQVAADQPLVELLEAGAAHLHLDAEIATEERYCDVTGKAATCCAT
jgi:hypothetical protein